MKTGDKVVCIKKGLWKSGNGTMHSDGPKFNEICTITLVRPGYTFSGDCIAVELVDYSHGYKSIWFEPLITDEELCKELESIETPCN